MLFLIIPSILLSWAMIHSPRDLIYYAILLAVLIVLSLAAVVDQIDGERE